MLYLSLLFLGIIPFSLFSMNFVVEYRHAVPEDLKAMEELYQNVSSVDQKKIVILPKNFREQSMMNSIKKNRYFVVYDRAMSCLIGLKKLFIVDDNDEAKEILNNELRCSQNQLLDYFQYDLLGCKAVEKKYDNQTHIEAKTLIDEGIILYNGGDYTKPQYRGRKCNAQVTCYALDSILEKVVVQLQKKRFLSFVFGLTHENAKEGSFSGRVCSIIPLFADFVKRVMISSNMKSVDRTMHCLRYKSYMPIFQEIDGNCVPCPDTLNIPGYGYVIIVKLMQQ